MPSKLRLILSDLDGVIRHWNDDLTYQAEQDLGLPRGCVFATAFTRERYQALCTGRVSDAQWREFTAQALEKDYGPRGRQVALFWSSLSARFCPETLHFLQEIAQDKRLCILTNGGDRVEQDVEEAGASRYFHRIYNTARIGVAKPDPRIYQHVLAKESVEASEVFFIDDKLENVLAAETLGMQGHHFQSLAGLREDYTRRFAS